MAKGIYVQEGRTLDYINGGADIAYCDVVKLTDCIGVAEDDIPNSQTGALSVAGVYELPAETTAGFTMGQKLYWDATNKCVSATSTGNTPCGIATAAKLQASATATVKIG